MAGKLTGISAMGLLIASVFWCACSCGTAPGYSFGPNRNYEAYDLIVSLDYDENAPPPVTATLTITSYKGGLADCFVNWGDWTYGDGLVGTQATHVYSESGQYLLRVYQKISDINWLWDYAEVRIGVRTELYDDPELGNIEIFDRQAFVFFSNPEQYSELETGLADIPEIAAFLEAENLTARWEWIYGGRLLVYMAEGMTIEEAAADWAVRYAGLVDRLEPIPVDENFLESHLRPSDIV